MPPKKQTKSQSNNSTNKPKKDTNTNLNRKRKQSELDNTPNKTSKTNQSIFKSLSSKMKGGKQTCQKHLQEKCSDTNCSDPHYTIVNVMEDNKFKDHIKKTNGCNDAMSKILGESNKEAIILEVIMRK
ncbi:hypothetical protein ABPG72_016522, partial [Tetrahymena utriculariae]